MLASPLVRLKMLATVLAEGASAGTAAEVEGEAAKAGFAEDNESPFWAAPIGLPLQHVTGGNVVRSRGRRSLTVIYTIYPQVRNPPLGAPLYRVLCSEVCAYFSMYKTSTLRPST